MSREVTFDEIREWRRISGMCMCAGCVYLSWKQRQNDEDLIDALNLVLAEHMKKVGAPLA